ncbi:MAG: alanine--glyoxylate aminotransferase family protein [Bdellovibrio sp.]|nr:alanine--glyoxylate aminotransferase family protein [Bdellovibrio sp.]
MSNPILLAPGPVQLHPEVQKILAHPMIHHRTPEFDQILSHALSGLKFLFQTKQPVLMHTSTGSGAMESALVNLLNPGDEVLAIVSGKFGERWAEMAEIFGGKVSRLNVAWGSGVHAEDVRTYLKNNPQIKIVMTQACETSTATVHDIKLLGEIVSETEALLLVDGITAVGAYPMPMDAYKIDALIAGSQKGIMLPTGLSFICLSEKAWAKAQTAKTPRYYFDLRKELKANQNGETLFSSPVPLVKSLEYVLSMIQKTGFDLHFKEIKRRADFTRAIGQKMGLTLYSKSPSDSVTAFNLPADIKGVELRAHLEKKYFVTVMGGQDQAKGKILRLGHMGYILDADMINTMELLALALADFNFNVNPADVRRMSEAWLKENPL